MAIRDSSYGYWNSTRGFLWTAAGAAMGIGNLARLPWLAGEYGGAIFLGAYFVFLAAIAWPLLVAEWMIGRWTREDLTLGLTRLTETARLTPLWRWIGPMSLLAAVLVLSYYSVIAGWSMAYAIRAAGGALSHLDAEGVQKTFFHLAQDPERSLAWHTLFMVAACIVVANGAREGIERLAHDLVPGAIVLTLVIFVYACFDGDSQGAFNHMLAPDWSHFGWRGALEALHQAFFTTALGLGAMVAYGSYLPGNAPMLRLAAGVIVLDTLFSLVAGGALYAMIFAAGLDPAPGLTALFQVFPLAIAKGGVNPIVATLMYLVVFLITLIAATALMEPGVRFLMEKLRTTRVLAAMSCAIGIWFLGLGTLLSFNVMQGFEIFGMNFFDWLQAATGRVIMPLGALLLAVFIRLLPADLVDEMWGTSNARALVAWRWLMRFPVRLGMIALLVYCLGIVDWLVGLWS